MKDTAHHCDVARSFTRAVSVSGEVIRECPCGAVFHRRGEAWYRLGWLARMLARTQLPAERSRHLDDLAPP